MEQSRWHPDNHYRKEAMSAWLEQPKRSLINSPPIPNETFSPYATVQLKRSNKYDSSFPSKRQLKSLANSPFTRIKRVERMIMAQKQQSQDNSLLKQPQITVSWLKPHFKIKSIKNGHQKEKKEGANQTSLAIEKFHVHNFTLENVTIDVIGNSRGQDLRIAGSGFSNFSETFKNRCRLQRRSPRKHQDASLLDRLNKISDQAPLQRYKSRAFESAHRVGPFLPH